MSNKTTKSDIIIFCGLFSLAFAVVFISCLNPFGSKTIWPGTGVYLTIAQGITRGQVPFRDFVDNKGPLLYLMSAPGMFFGGLTGVWITELILMLVSVFFAYKIALFYGNKHIAFLGVVCSFIYLQTFFGEVAGTEEYSLPFMMISLYIFIKYFFTQKDPPVHELIVLGACLAINIFIRINHFPLWLGFCTVIIIESVLKKKYSSLLRYVLFFCVGILIVAVPVFFYLYLNNAFTDYIYQNFRMGTARGMSEFSFLVFVRSFVYIYGKNYSSLPLLIYFFVWIIKRDGNIFLNFGLLLSYLLTILFLAVIGSSYDYYNLVLTPFLVPAFMFCIKFAINYFSDVKYKNILLVLLFCAVSARNMLSLANNIFLAIKYRYINNELVLAGQTIDQNTNANDTIIALQYCREIYLFTERRAASRYIYQTSGIDYGQNAHEEFLKDMRENKPKIIVIENKEGHYEHLPEWYSPIYDMIAKEYRILSNENRYFLFIRD
jgi:hypothetical protein